MWNLENDSNEFVCKAEMETWMQRTSIWIPRGAMNWETGIDTYTLLCPKQIPNEDYCIAENSTQCCGDLNEKDIQKRGDILFIQLIHFAVQQKLIQHCKATIF